MSERPEYLEPYRRAALRHGSGFGTLLWASPVTQGARFDAIARLVNLSGLTVLDVGCGRADFADFLIRRRVKWGQYVGIEGTPELAEAARAKELPRSLIVEADFVVEPKRLFVGVDVVMFSGTLNTLDAPTFYRTLEHAYEAAGRAVVFNFLCSPTLAAADYLTWHRADDVVAFAKTVTPRVRTLEDYLPGDYTVAMAKG